MSRQRFLRAAALALFIFCGAPFLLSVMAQSAWQPGAAGIGFGKQPGKQWVQMVSSPDLVLAHSQRGGEQGSVALRFAIQTGLHINSHTPHSSFLIPTTLTLEPRAGVQVAQVEYPVGVDYHFAFSPKDALSVYTGEFGLIVQVHARPGEYTLHGRLHYQACDSRACNPPRTLPLTLHVTAK